MATGLKPSEYLIKSRQWFMDTMSSETADMYVSALRDKDTTGITNLLYIPPCIPEKYHASMQAIWRNIIAQIVFTRTSQKVTKAERYRLASKIR